MNPIHCAAVVVVDGKMASSLRHENVGNVLLLRKEIHYYLSFLLVVCYWTNEYHFVCSCHYWSNLTMGLHSMWWFSPGLCYHYYCYLYSLENVDRDRHKPTCVFLIEYHCMLLLLPREPGRKKEKEK